MPDRVLLGFVFAVALFASALAEGWATVEMVAGVAALVLVTVMSALRSPHRPATGDRTSRACLR